MAFSKDIRESGAMKSGAPLQGTATATTLRGNSGRRHHGRSVRRDEGASGRVLHDRGQKSRRRAGDRRAHSLAPVGGSVEVRPVMQMGPPQK